MHFYSHHIGDYNRDTSALSMIEHGAYRLLMDAYYATEKPLTADLPALCRMCRAMSKIEKESVENVVRKFFATENGILTHKRIEMEIAAYREICEKRSESGKKGGRPKNQMESNSLANEKQVGKQNESKTKAIQYPVPSTQGTESAPLALPFDSAPFLDAWGKWVQFRREMKKKLTPSMIAEQFKEFAAIGETRTVAMILFTIKMGWQGLREPSANGFQPQKPKHVSCL